MMISVSALKDKDPIDAHYERLNTEISVLEKDTKEYKAGVANRHSQYHIFIFNRAAN